jgi:hypothetical protein
MISTLESRNTRVVDHYNLAGGLEPRFCHLASDVSLHQSDHLRRTKIVRFSQAFFSLGVE